MEPFQWGGGDDGRGKGGRERSRVPGASVRGKNAVDVNMGDYIIWESR